MDINSVSGVLTTTLSTRPTGGAPQVPVDSSPSSVPVSLSESMGSGLGEIQASAPAVENGPYPDSQTLVLKEETGSGNLPVKVATAIYVLNHSFDEQKGALDLIA